jgi:hypothetical protein
LATANTPSGSSRLDGFLVEWTTASTINSGEQSRIRAGRR